MPKIATLFCVLSALAGCATALVREEPRSIRLGEAGVSCATAPLAEALLARRGSAIHSVQGSWKDHVFAAECVVKCDPGRFTAIFLAPQMRLATLTVTPPHVITFERARQIPSAFEPEYALFDLAVVNLQADELRRALGDMFDVVERGGTRVVSAAGEQVAVRIALPDGSVRYENITLGYSYTLKEIR